VQEGTSKDKLFFKGAFDHFHKGHELFLKTVASFGKPLVAGIAVQAEVDQDFETRRTILKEKLTLTGQMFEIVPLGKDFFKVGAVNRDDLQFFAFSPDEKPLAEEINKQRAVVGKTPLIFIEVPPFLSEDKKPLSSTRIREGTVDKEGRLVRRKAALPKSKSTIRNNFVELFLEEPNPLYGYQINKKYVRKYGRLSLRLTYYHLAKGVSEGLFKIREVKTHSGGYSWGPNSERVYYELTTT
jgi:phosphopantetheine adenylyltransferase